MNLVEREFVARYRGFVLGVLWYLIVPVLTLAMYTLVFTKIFPARWAGTGTMSFALLFFVGLIIFTVFMETVNRCVGLMKENQNYIKKVVFPVEVLPVVVIIVAMINAMISSVAALGMYWLIFGVPPLTALLLPLMILPLILFSLGFGFFLSSLGVFIRDIGQIVTLMSTFLLFLSPIFYPLSVVPAVLRPYIYLNPLTSILEQTRGVLFRAELPDWTQYSISLTASLLIVWFGYAWFMKTKKAFADVL